MKKISKNISYKEATNSATAKRKKIANKPKAEHIKNMDDVFGLVFSNKILLNAQDEASASYCSRIKKSDSIINFTENKG